jgi:hypothetical protein
MKIVPRYVHIKTLAHNIAAIKTQTQTLRIKNEIKFLYKRKQQLDKELYYIHIQYTNTWKYTWNNIEQSINQKLQNKMKIIHEKQQQKIHKLSKSQKIHNTREQELP